MARPHAIDRPFLAAAQHDPDNNLPMTPDDDANDSPTEAGSPPAARRTPLSNIRIPSDWLAWRFLGLAHMAGLVLFIVMMAGFLWYVGHVKRQEQQTALLRHTD